jgi:hypothetical protein
LTEKYYPFYPKRVLAFLYAQAGQGDVHIERSSSHLTVQAPDVLFFVRWSTTYARLFEGDGPSRVRLTEKRDCLAVEVSAEQHWYSTLQQCFGDGQTVPATVTSLLGQRGVCLYRKVVDEQRETSCWIPKAVTDLLAETVEELNQFFHWQLSPETGWLAGLGLQSRGSLFLRLGALEFDDEESERRHG